ncbi:MAG: hypothetical protein JGK04_22365 [Microcoleus sp. PH2017_39_LGB_O_B]|uniref:hypothetical protein n=1 Tax=unclassified Microcoleus TaxID=2642155 RepID=UPI001E07A6E7|nr:MULTISPECIES: hypothetical protein [unclassified Microcoleus]MCC3450182.1 hypothetical protein [Microcoleus sp. PH2017_09_SFU_O_A]MCC3631087.1 hypothetical protein [Microcoleus sp. PH2017_39_LGB_O_B]MCC3643299.1 hypothetical protein [Microcoleus sp. PH2017_33_LGB_O_A]
MRSNRKSLVISHQSSGRRKKEEGRGKKEEGRGKKEEGRGKKEEGRRKREEGSCNRFNRWMLREGKKSNYPLSLFLVFPAITNSPLPIPHYQFPITNSPLPIPDYYCQLSTVNCQLTNYDSCLYRN